MRLVSMTLVDTAPRSREGVFVCWSEESAAMKRGGFIAPITRHVTCIVEDGVPIPEKIELECTDVKLKEVIREERLIFPEGVSMSPTVDRELFLVGTVFGRSSEVDEEEVVEDSSDGPDEELSPDAAHVGDQDVTISVGRDLGRHVVLHKSVPVLPLTRSGVDMIVIDGCSLVQFREFQSS